MSDGLLQARVAAIEIRVPAESAWTADASRNVLRLARHKQVLLRIFEAGAVVLG
jgi:hypothetical protein